VFTSYNLVEFGNTLREIRKGQGISQVQVKNAIGISEGILRKIEHGLMLPEYDILEMMSLVYKVNLIEYLERHRLTLTLYDLYQATDQLLITYTPEGLSSIEGRLNRFEEQRSNERLPHDYPVEIMQFEFFLSGLSIYFEGNITKRNTAYLNLVEALSQTLKDFTPSNFKHYKYSFYEIRILLFMGMILYDLRQEVLSNQILEFCLKYFLLNLISEPNIQNLIVKIYNNLAYNYHLSNQHDKVLKTTDNCIAFSIRHNNLYGLASIYYRKGISSFRLHRPDYLDILNKSVMLCEVSGNQDLADLYRRMTLEYYGILIQ